MTNAAVEYCRKFWNYRISNTLQDCSNCKNHTLYNCDFGCWTDGELENIENFICEAYE